MTTTQWGIREVALATFFDLTTGKALVQLSNLKTAGLENSAETVYARGGRGNAKIMGFSSNREGKVVLQDAVFTNQVLAMLTGNGLVNASQNIYKREVLTVTGGAASLKHTPASGGALIGVYTLKPDGSHGTELSYTSAAVAAGTYKITGKALAFHASDLADGAQAVAYYQTASAPASSKITVSSDKFAGSFKVVLDCLVRDAVTQKDYAAQVVIGNAKMDNNWKIQTAATGDPSAFDITLDILKPVNGTEMWTMTVYDETLLA
ncbi:hypothetical protein [Paenibacillus contaminans]|uniref:Uncharacterized protein n=1 Tax=Paenibacillus contaminans TaxID=450362 RepID=A0A329LWS5_9BACL|nr:hypothetical protein [Paenibacillus contaminans]RAV12174.1 hypothetical protein DQG23_35220 [Paenibacillus contaminans]